jgi:endonuclease G, mitochondrial
MKTTLLTVFLLATLLQATDLSQYINKQNCSQIIDKQVFTICYDYKAKGAKYVSYTLDGYKVNVANTRSRPSFYTEKNLKKKYRSASKDYENSGYDKGHLANHGSFDYDEKAKRKTYTMANVIPQAPMVNQYHWSKAERLERKVAVSLGSVSVLNGVLYSSNPLRIGKNQIAVPDGYWKMIYNDDKNYKKCFYYENDLDAVAKGDKLKSHLVDCSGLTQPINY